MRTPTIDLINTTDWPEPPCPNGLAAAIKWAVEQGYQLNAVPVTPETVKSAFEAGIDATWVVHLIDRDTAIAVGLGCWYARDIDQAPRDDTRAAAVEEGLGYDYALHVDHCPREDTRAAAVVEGRGYFYARWVDRCPRADTRQAAIAAGWGYSYARFVDMTPRDDTRAAAIAEGVGYEYGALFSDA